jgi:hypothetical protein
MTLRLFIFLLLFAIPGAAQAEEWYAMARHGECVDLGKLNEKKNLLKGAKTPGEMEKLFKKAGVEYSIEPMIKDQDGILKLNAPSESLAMILVKKEFCKEFIIK